jgi:hypothetical protein
MYSFENHPYIERNPTSPPVIEVPLGTDAKSGSTEAKADARRARKAAKKQRLNG